MGFWDAITGRRAPRQARLDALFGVPSAAITLQAAADLAPTGVGSVCYRAAEGAAFSSAQADIVELLNGDPEAPDVERSVDEFGFSWLVVRRDPSDTAGLCTDLHAVNVMLEEQGFGPSLLCSVVGFAGAGERRVGLVYLYKQGTFYAFAPTGPQSRDNLLEISVRDHLAGELPVEKDLQRWLALWGAPGL
ncbi:PspA-associated protein PspAB [Nocardioides alkalitolerans]|uniref:PspA-associated protein PspAB n=1 Tax=Nocardioides alkalitolerans TaxID=281714 RepID=UPI00041200C2|nr:hypothetical protein [Nocardioides alkalitolerans]